jgi:phosphopantothenoylcysteine decarboxylase / phosphopantothenate---cysteine ligase
MKKVIVGISGSIAAYKAATLVRLLIKSGAEVRVLMTDSATQFIAPLTLATLSKHDVLTEVSTEQGWNNHVELGLWADAYIIAPATANTLAKMANGLCDSILTAVYLSARCPVYIAPAMDLDMWHHQATKRNLDLLAQDGVRLIPVGHGELASGLIGDGRMAEPEDIARIVMLDLPKAQMPFSGKKVMITAGPTYESIDPVRFIGNRSTGKMGIALAEAFAKQGAEVVLILGPSSLRPQNSAIQLVDVQTAQEMYDAAAMHHVSCQIAVFSAAVADYRPAQIADQKIKKKGDKMDIELVKTIDIAATLGQKKQKGQVHLGFALETEHELAYAEKKLATKQFDLIVLNSLRDAGAGFGHDTNKVIIVDAEGQKFDLPLQSKTDLAFEILKVLASRIVQPKSGLKSQSKKRNL